MERINQNGFFFLAMITLRLAVIGHELHLATMEQKWQLVQQMVPFSFGIFADA